MMKGIVSIVLLGATVNGCRLRGNSPGAQGARGSAPIKTMGGMALGYHRKRIDIERSIAERQIADSCAEDITKSNCPQVDGTKKRGAYATVQCLRASTVSDHCTAAMKEWRALFRIPAFTESIGVEPVTPPELQESTTDWGSSALQMDYQSPQFGSSADVITRHQTLRPGHPPRMPRRHELIKKRREGESEGENEMQVQRPTVHDNMMSRRHHGHGPHGPPGRQHPHHFPRDHPRGPNGKHERPRTAFGVLARWFSGDSEDDESRDSSDSSSSDSSDSSSSDSSDDVFHTNRHHGWRNQKPRHGHPLAHRLNHGDMSRLEMELAEENLVMEGRIRGSHIVYSKVYEDSQHDHIGSRNRMPYEFEEARIENRKGCTLLIDVLSFFFFVGAITLIVMPFILFARALRILVRGGRRGRGTSSPSSFPFSRDNGAAAAVPDGYEVLPEDAEDEAIVVTGTPVNPPPSVNI